MGSVAYAAVTKKTKCDDEGEISNRIYIRSNLLFFLSPVVGRSKVAMYRDSPKLAQDSGPLQAMHILL